MLPEPGQIGGQSTAGDADDLIAKLADAEIDKLMAVEEAGGTPSLPARAPIEEPAPVVAEPRAPIVQSDPIADLERSTAAANALEAALNAAVETAPQPSTAMAVAPPPPRAEERSVDADAVAAELAADAALHGKSAEPLPPEPAAETSSPAVHVEPELNPQPIGVGRESPVSTDAVAAADPVAPAVESDAPRPSLVQRLSELPWVALDLLNYPARSASDKAREVMGVVAIVTVVNATGLLIYRAFFARH